MNIVRSSPSIGGSLRCFSTGKYLLQVQVPVQQSPQAPETNSFDAAALKIIKKRSNKKRSETLLHLKGKTGVKSFNSIVSESGESYDNYFTKPRRRWASIIKKRFPDLFKGKETPTTGKIRSVFNGANLSITSTNLFEPLNIGDAVELTSSLNQSGLGVVVDVPSSDDDPRYTIMNRLGELTYVEKSSIKFRIPGVIPKEWLYRIIHEVHNPPQGHGSTKTTFTGFRTFAVNTTARNIIIEPLINITNRAWSEIQATSRKLEIIHRLIQTDGPREVSIFSLVKAVNLLNVDLLKNDFKGKQIDRAYEDLSKLFKNSGDKDMIDLFEPTKLGKNYGALDENETFEASIFYSVVLSLRKQNRLWSTSYSSRSTMVPLSITVYPVEYSTNVEYIIEMIKSQPELTNFFQNSINSMETIKAMDKDTYDAFFYLLKEYAVGNLTDAKSVTLVSQLMKQYSDEDITRSIVYDFLIKAGHISPNLTNPTHFSTSLNLPYTNVSAKATNEEIYFENVDVKSIRSEDLANERKDYTELKVYCIDSETAHEIDDGISIAKIDDDNVMLYVHIADPTSYMTHDGTLTKIAFERAFTTYQPELIASMLPKSMSKLAGLGVDGKKTRALTFSIPFNKKNCSFDFKNSNVEASYLSKFPKYTYNDVDEVLKNVKNQFKVDNDEHQDLKELYEVALKLRAFRINDGAVVFGESFSPQIQVSTIDENFKNSNSSGRILGDFEVNINKQETTDSVVLVSELMILGNRIAGSILAENREGYDGIFKGMNDLPLNGTARTVVKRLNMITVEKNIFPKASDLVKAFKFIVPAYYSHEPKDHLMLGVDHYAPSTSPLRRFGDLINHFQFHSILNKQESFFTKEQIISIALHIEARSDILKKFSRLATNYYSIKLLENDIEKGKQISSGFLVSSRPINGQTSGILVDLGIQAIIKLSPNKEPPYIGKIMSNYEIESLNSAEGRVTLKEI